MLKWIVHCLLLGWVGLGVTVTYVHRTVLKAVYWVYSNMELVCGHWSVATPSCPAGSCPLSHSKLKTGRPSGRVNCFLIYWAIGSKFDCLNDHLLSQVGIAEEVVHLQNSGLLPGRLGKNELHEVHGVQLFKKVFPPNLSIFPPNLDLWKWNLEILSSQAVSDGKYVSYM